ncbi:MAG: RNA polymerase sigma-70 factor [Rikenellaceae bacterium]|nr:RNA polymerase sigma-70 factor [Rikenellaceae bacterium]
MAKKSPIHTDSFSESQLTARIRRRDPQIFLHLYDRYYNRLHRYAYQYVSDYDTANDIVQSVFIGLYEHAPRLAPDTSPGSWLYVSVRNRSLNYLRDHRIEVHNQYFYLENYEEQELAEHLEDNGELLSRIREIVQQMPPKRREIFEMRFFQNLRQTEIAEALSLSTNTVKVQLHRAIQKIRETLSSSRSTGLPLLLFLLSQLEKLD